MPLTPAELPPSPHRGPPSRAIVRALGPVAALAPLAACVRDGVAVEGESVEIVTSCPADASVAVRTQLGVPYAVRAGRTLRLDVERPTGATAASLIILLHGGG